MRQILIEYYSDCESTYLVGVRHIEHQGIRKKQAADTQAQAKAKAESDAQAQAKALDAQKAHTLVQGQVPRGPPIATTGPAPPRGPPPMPEGASEWFSIIQKSDMQRRADAAQAQAAKATATRPVAPEPITTAQQAAQRGQQSADKFAYIAAIDSILKDIFKGEKLVSSTVQAIRTHLETHPIPVEQVRKMTKEQLRGLLTTESRSLRSRAAKKGGFTRKNSTSSFRMTHRLSRQ